jgi:hypothetical protein
VFRGYLSTDTESPRAIVPSFSLSHNYVLSEIYVGVSISPV